MSEKPKSKPVSLARRRLLKRLALGTMLMIGGAAGDAYAVEPDALRVETHDVAPKHWPATASGLRVGLLSDLHCNSDAAVSRTARAAHLLLAQKPDVVALTGDFVSGHSRRNWAGECADALAPLTDALPGHVFAVLGNHDWWSGEPDEVARELERVGVQVLRNQSVPLPLSPDVWLVGLDSRCVNAQNPARALRGVPADAAKLLLIHEPDYADEAPPGFALQLSGHSHGGQVRFPGWGPILRPRFGRRYPEGLAHGPHHPVYTTRGIGMIGPPVRLCCPPEVTLLRLKASV